MMTPDTLFGFPVEVDPTLGELVGGMEVEFGPPFVPIVGHIELDTAGNPARTAVLDPDA